MHAGSVQRFSIGDAAELAGDVGPDQRLIGVLIELDAAVPLARLRDQVAAMVRARPILSRRFVRRGRATWRAGWQQVEVQNATCCRWAGFECCRSPR